MTDKFPSPDAPSAAPGTTPVPSILVGTDVCTQGGVTAAALEAELTAPLAEADPSPYPEHPAKNGFCPAGALQAETRAPPIPSIFVGVDVLLPGTVATEALKDGQRTSGQFSDAPARAPEPSSEPNGSDVSLQGGITAAALVVERAAPLGLGLRSETDPPPYPERHATNGLCPPRASGDSRTTRITTRASSEKTIPYENGFISPAMVERAKNSLPARILASSQHAHLFQDVPTPPAVSNTSLCARATPMPSLFVGIDALLPGTVATEALREGRGASGQFSDAPALAPEPSSEPNGSTSAKGTPRRSSDSTPSGPSDDSTLANPTGPQSWAVLAYDSDKKQQSGYRYLGITGTALRAANQAALDESRQPDWSVVSGTAPPTAQLVPSSETSAPLANDPPRRTWPSAQKKKTTARVVTRRPMSFKAWATICDTFGGTSEPSTRPPQPPRQDVLTFVLRGELDDYQHGRRKGTFQGR
ncbi:hypothetical protein T484DRAFT_1860634, partial [Baffinella frigidus]